MDGCEGCFQSAKGMQQALEAIRSKAIQYGKEQKKPVAIYKEGFEYRYCDTDVAFAQHYDIIEVVSKYL